MPSSNADTCASTSTSSTSEDAEGHLDPRKGTSVSTPEMGGRNSVSELVGKDSVKENIAFSGNCQDLEGFNNNVKATHLGEFCEDVTATERKSCDNPVDCESAKVVHEEDEHFETHGKKKALAGKENSFGNGNPKSEDASELQELESHEEDDVKVVSETCDSISSITTTIVVQENSNQEKNNSDIACSTEKKENGEQKTECNANLICNVTIGKVSDNLGQDNSDVSIEVEKTNGKENIDGMCIENKTSKKTVLSRGQCQEPCEAENTMNNDVNADRSQRHIEITPEKKHSQINITLLDFKNGKEHGSADTVDAPTEGPCDVDQSPDGPEQQIDNVKVVSETCDSISGITITILQENSNQEKNNSDIACSTEKKENGEQKTECNANPICNVTIGKVSDNLGQDNSDVLIEVEKTNGKENIDGMCIENKTSKKTVPSRGQCQEPCEAENTMNNDVNAERSQRHIEITPEKQQSQINITLLDFKNGKEHGSADTVGAPTEDPCEVDQSPVGREQQIDNEPNKSEVFLRKKGQETGEIEVISMCSDEILSNHELHAIEDVHGIDSACQQSEIESIPSSQDVNEKTSLCECDLNTNMRDEDNLNKKDSGRLPVRNEFNTERSTNYAKSPTRECTAYYSSDNSPTKKSPIFQRGLFPRIAIRNPGTRAANKLRKQLFLEKEKREQQEGDKALEMKKLRKQHVIDSKDSQNFSEFTKICTSPNDIKLKCAQIILVKMNASMLSKYNVHFPSLHFDASIDRTLNPVSLSCDKNSYVSEKRHNLEPKIVECAAPIEGEQKTSAKSSPDKKDENQLLKRSIVDSTSHPELPPGNIISNSRTNCDTTSLDKNSNSVSGIDNTLSGGKEIKRRSKRRETVHAFTPSKKQKQSEMKEARVNICKIDDLVLLKYGYDSKGLQIDKAAIVPFPSAHSSISSVVGRSQADENVNSPIHRNPLVSAQPNTNVFIPVENKMQLTTMKKSDTREMIDVVKKSAVNSHKITNSETAKKSFDVETVPLPNHVVLKNTSLSPKKSLRKTKCSIGKSNRNLTPQIVIKRIDKKSLSSHILSKKACNRSPAKTNSQMKGSIKKAELDGKVSSMIVKRNKHESLSGRNSFNKSRSTTNRITKKKNSIKDKYNLKTAQVVLKNINNSPLSSHILSEYLMSKSESNARVSKTKLHVESTKILQKRLLPKKQIISRSTYGDIDNRNEVDKKASSSKDVQDHSKENMCLNSDLKCLKGVRVNLYKLESMVQPKLLSSKSVLSL